MEVSDSGSMSLGDDAELVHDLATLSAQALRRKYAREANSHRNMKRRALKEFEVDPEWDTFAAFLRDMGRKPQPSFSLDRIDPTNLRYGPGLCRWGSPALQTINRRNTIWVEWEGQRRTLAEFARLIDAAYEKVHYRWSRGMALQSIAKSLAARAPGYRPLRYADDADGLTKWLAKYEAWRRTTRSDRRKFAVPEVFDLLAINRLYPVAKEIMERRGYFDQTNTPEYLAALRQSDLVPVLSEGWAWAGHAIAALQENHPKVAAYILGNRPGNNVMAYAAWYEWFREPVE